MDGQEKSTVTSPNKSDKRESDECIDNRETLQHGLHSLFDNPKYSDVIIKVGELQFNAHKLLLANASEVFAVMLINENWVDSGRNEIILEETQACQELFKDFLRYMYSGQVVVSSLTVLPLLVLSDKYAMVELRRSCADFMTRHIADSPNTNRAITWYQYAKSCNMSDLQDTCCNFIVLNMDTVIQSDDWETLSEENLVEFMQRSDMVIENELKLVHAVQRWLITNFDADDHGLKRALEAILPHLRLTMIPPEDLQELEASAFFQFHQSSLSPYMLCAYRHHAVCQDVEAGPAFAYRNYTGPSYQIQADFSVPGYKRLLGQRARDRREITLSAPVSSSVRSIESPANPKFKVEFYPTGFYVSYDSRPRRANTEPKLIIKVANGASQVTADVAILLYSKREDNTFVYKAPTFQHNFETSGFDSGQLLDLTEVENGTSPFIVDDTFQFKVIIKPHKALQEMEH